MSTAAPSRRWQHAMLVLVRPGPPQPLAIGRWIIIAALAMVLFWGSVYTLVALYEIALPIAFALATLQCVSLPLAVRLPRSAILLQLTTIVLAGNLTRGSIVDEFWPTPIVNLFVLIIVLVVLGVREKWVVSVSAWWLSVLAMTIVVVLNPDPLATADEWGDDLLIGVTVTLVALVVSVFIGQRARVREIVAAAKRDVELEQARRATIEERARIARELHDVVAHSMSIVHIQAESARYRIDDIDSARAEFTDIARSARSALGEMRRLLEALHPDDGETFYAPQPTILDIPTLVDGAEKVGSTVAFTNDVEPGALSPVLELTAYRIVQEALSNVIRHAPKAHVDVSLVASPGEVTVRVQNDPAPTNASSDTATRESGGRGLRGMRERVALVHGHIEQDPLPDGGFIVVARIPITLKDTP